MSISFKNPKVSIIVTASRRKHLISCLVSIAKSNYKNFELIIVVDTLNNKVIEISQKYSKKIIINETTKGTSLSREIGIRASTGSIIVNIDSDVVIKKDSISKIVAFFNSNKSYAALTGILDNKKEVGFFTDYKNLYMHYYFKLLPPDITFLYGSIFAIKRTVINKILLDHSNTITEDTTLGQQLIKNGYKIAIHKELEVQHLKQYSFKSILINDFRVPYSWAHVFWKYNGLEQINKNNTGYAHASRSQISSLIITPVITVLLFININLSISLIFFWTALNFDFFSYLNKKRGSIYCIKSIFFTLTDHVTMFFGVALGSLHYFFSILKNAKPD